MNEEDENKPRAGIFKQTGFCNKDPGTKLYTCVLLEICLPYRQQMNKGGEGGFELEYVTVPSILYMAYVQYSCLLQDQMRYSLARCKHQRFEIQLWQLNSEVMKLE